MIPPLNSPQTPPPRHPRPFSPFQKQPNGYSPPKTPFLNLGRDIFFPDAYTNVNVFPTFRLLWGWRCDLEFFGDVFNLGEERGCGGGCGGQGRRGGGGGGGGVGCEGVVGGKERGKRGI